MTIGAVLQTIYIYVSSVYKSVRFSYHRFRELRRYGNYYFPYREELTGKRVYILANGPSLNSDLVNLLKDKTFEKSIKCVTNFFANSDIFCKLKPSIYILADPKFFQGKIYERENLLIKKINEAVTWPMTLFVVNWGESLAKEIISNPNITIRSTSVLKYDGPEKDRFRYYKNGWAVPSYVNVLMMAEYVLLNMGCKDIRLYGVEHTFFEGMTVDDNNHVCILEKHHYGEKYTVKIDCNGNFYTTAGWLMDKYLTFKEHEIMRGYSDYLGAKIINCTKGSLIDAYIRLSQINKEQ